MKKIFCLTAFLLIVLLSCSLEPDTKTITVVLPLHEWEKQTSNSLWYTLKWTYQDQIRSLHLNSNNRTADIRIKSGETVIICAYPMDRLNPIGMVISPLDTRSCFVLDANVGILAGSLINIDRRVTSKMNIDVILEKITKTTPDLRDLDIAVFLSSTLNGNLGEDSICSLKKNRIDPLFAPNGYWIAENQNDPSFYITEGITPQMELPIGTYSWLCDTLKMELVICVDSCGNITCSTRLSNVV